MRAAMRFTGAVLLGTSGALAVACTPTSNPVPVAAPSTQLVDSVAPAPADGRALCRDGKGQTVHLHMTAPDSARVGTPVPVMIRAVNPHPVPLEFEVLGDTDPTLIQVHSAFGLLVYDGFREIPVTFGTLHFPARGTVTFQQVWSNAGNPRPFRVNAAYFIEGFILTRERRMCRATRRIWITD